MDIRNFFAKKPRLSESACGDSRSQEPQLDKRNNDETNESEIEVVPTATRSTSSLGKKNN